MMEKYFGKYSGIVIDNRDDQRLGHLQVSVPAIFPSEDAIVARPALPYGVYFVPEVDAKVWIEFEGGDPGLPIWTGLQSVPGEWPQEADISPPQKRLVKTASGHLLLFNDKGGEEGIEIESNARIVIRCPGTIVIESPNLILNGRLVAPLPPNQPI